METLYHEIYTEKESDGIYFVLVTEYEEIKTKDLNEIINKILEIIKQQGKNVLHIFDTRKKDKESLKLYTDLLTKAVKKLKTKYKTRFKYIEFIEGNSLDLMKVNFKQVLGSFYTNSTSESKNKFFVFNLNDKSFETIYINRFKTVVVNKFKEINKANEYKVDYENQGIESDLIAILNSNSPSLSINVSGYNIVTNLMLPIDEELFLEIVDMIKENK